MRLWKKKRGPDVEIVEALEPIAVPAMVASPDGRIRSGRLAGLTMGAAIWVLSWPILAESFLNSLVGLVDTMLSAGLSESATDAVGGASYFMWFLSMIGQAIGVGATAMVSRAIGAGRQAVANAAVGQSMLLSVLVGVVVGAAVFAAAPWAARSLHMSPEAQAQFITYLRICALGVPALSILGSGAASCRGAGDSIGPLWTMVAVNVVNIGASWLLSGVDIAIARVGEGGAVTRHVLLANPLDLDMGITGVAIGTLVAWHAGALIVTGLLIRGESGVRLRARRLRPHWHTMRRLVRIGIPNFLETFGMWIGNMLILFMVGWMAQPGLLGSHIVAIRVEAFSFLPGFAMGVAAATLAGQYLGAGNAAMAARALRVCTGMAAAFMALCGVAFILTPEPIVGIFTQQPAHMQVAPKLLAVTGFVQIPFAIALVLRGGLRGAGDTKWVMWITWITTYAIRIPLAWIFCGVDIPLPDWLGGGAIVNPKWFDFEPLVGLWIGLCAELVLRSMGFLWRFLQGGWKHVRV